MMMLSNYANGDLDRKSRSQVRFSMKHKTISKVLFQLPEWNFRQQEGTMGFSVLRPFGMRDVTQKGEGRPPSPQGGDASCRRCKPRQGGVSSTECNVPKPQRRGHRFWKTDKLREVILNIDAAADFPVLETCGVENISEFCTWGSESKIIVKN